MADRENSYQSARKDALKAAAVIGAVAATHWGYRKFKKHEKEIDNVILGLAALIGITVMLPLLLPAYIYFKKTVEGRSSLNIKKWSGEREQLDKRLRQIQSRIAEVASRDQANARQALRPIERQIESLDGKIYRAAVLWATRLDEHLREAESERRWLLQNLDRYGCDELNQRLRENDGKQAPLRERLEELMYRFEAEPEKSFLYAFRTAFSGRLIACIVLGVVIFLVAIIN